MPANDFRNLVQPDELILGSTNPIMPRVLLDHSSRTDNLVTATCNTMNSTSYLYLCQIWWRLRHVAIPHWSAAMTWYATCQVNERSTTAGPPVNEGQQKRSMTVNGGRPSSTTTEPPPDLRQKSGLAESTTGRGSVRSGSGRVWIGSGLDRVGSGSGHGSGRVAMSACGTH
ncbi:hypothetical protein Tco_1510910 [Tanacetum coccineum]